MSWKKENDALVMDEHGNPIWIHEDGNEAGWNVQAQLASTKALVEDKKKLKVKVGEVEAKLNTFNGYEPDKLENAFKALGDFEAGKLLDAGKKSEAIQKALEEQAKEFTGKMTAFETQQKELLDKLQAEKARSDNMLLHSNFDRSEFLSKKTSMPPDIAALKFGPKFKFEEVNGALQPVGYNGDEKLYSMKPEKAGKVAGFNEALEIMFNQYEGRNSFMKDLPSGPGSPGGQTIHGNDKVVILKGEQAQDVQLYHKLKAEGKTPILQPQES